MSVKGRNLFLVGLTVASLVGALLACRPTSEVKTLDVVINSPTSGSTVAVGQEVLIDSTVTAAAGVDRVALSIDGQVVRHDSPPEGAAPTFRVVQPWTPTAEGQVTVAVVAHDAGGASDQATITLQAVASGGGVPTDGSESVVPPGPTETPPPPVTTEAGCTLNAAYVADVTIPDGTVTRSGVGFVKTWRVRNSGTCDWGTGFELVFVTGERMEGEMTLAVPPTAAGSTVDLSVHLTAPDVPGTYRGDWRIRSDEEVSFGSQLYLQIVVPEESMATVTSEPTTEPTVGPTEAGPLPNLETYVFRTDPSSLVAGADFSIEVTVNNYTFVPVADFTIHVLLMDPGESCFEGGSGTLFLNRQASIAARQMTTVTTTASINSPGSHTLCLRIDPQDDIEELYEDDNMWRMTTSVAAAPLPQPDFQIYGHTFHDCSGQTSVTFLIKNTGDLPLEWARLRLEDLDDSLAIFPESDRPFKANPTDCGFSSEGETLGVGATGYIGWSTSFMTSGNSARATVTLCTENGGGGLCEERTLDFTAP